MNFSDGIIDKWAEEATQDLGKKSWRDINPNSMMLIIYAVQMSKNRGLVRKITRPIWWLFGAVGTGIIWWIIKGVFHIGG